MGKDAEDESSKPAIYVLSDGTGETAALMLKAALVQFKTQDVKFFRYKNVRNKAQLLSILDHLPEKRGLIVHTLVSPDLRALLSLESSKRGLLAVDLMGPVLENLSFLLNKDVDLNALGPGELRTVDDKYFQKIAAIEFTVKYDDGKCLDGIDKADIVLVGISRTSKTPLSIFLSYKGLKVANVPLVFGQAVPEELFKIDQKKIVGLKIEIEALQRIRMKRLEKFGQDPHGSYASLSHINKEIQFAEELFSKNKRWPVVNVTDRALEETAAEIARIVSSRLGLKKDFFF
jgi:regulator of PEP synthase PpsR (kinase-PPPase family)